jgi:hypothetical protein
MFHKGTEPIKDSLGPGARGYPAAKAWNWVVFQNTSVFRKAFRSIDQRSVLNPIADTINRVVSHPHSLEQSGCSFIKMPPLYFLCPNRTKSCYNF